MELLGVEAVAGGAPVQRSELEESRSRPVGQDADEVAKVALGVELVQARGGDEAEDVSGGLGVLVAAGEQGSVANADDLAQRVQFTA